MGKGNWFLSIIEKNKGVLVMIFVQLVYSGMALFSKAAISKGMNPYVFVAYRQAFATLALAPFAFFLDRITLSLNLYAYAINYVSATFASASNNTIPALTFLIAVAFRIESFSIRNSPGIVKLVGSVVSLSGAMVFAFVKGPRVNFMNWHTGTDENQLKTNPVINFSSKEKWIQGCLLMLSANTAWASWLVIQGVVVTGITYWLQLWAVESKGPLFVAIFSPLTLIFTAIISAFLWKETLYLGSVCGGILLVGGLYCVLWGKNKEAQKQANQEQTQPQNFAKEETIV
ncbi:UNVERIFIED_CONTAM: WAT1-related protein [Sesamum indicum]